ncbi:hypothetical protein D9M72_378050 [compost metagenome]
MLPTNPIGSLKMWVVGVAPCGRHHWPSFSRRAVFSWAPAIEIRKSSSSSGTPPGGGGATVARRICATSRSLRGCASTRWTPAGTVSSGRICRAPTQSRPICASKSKASVVLAWNRRAIRCRMVRLSGSRLSKYDRTFSPRRGAFPGVNGNDNDRGRPCAEEAQSGEYTRVSPWRGFTCQVPTWVPFIHRPRARVCERRPIASPGLVGRRA